jgi:flavocytochrome c
MQRKRVLHSLRHTSSHHPNIHKPMADAIVVGSGLAGMAATLNILDRGGFVILIEKEPLLGGNSNKASSGINACCLERDRRYNDTLDSFYQDTLHSAGNVANLELIDTLVSNSAEAMNWLEDRTGIQLRAIVQLGGHSRPRTHRPIEGFVGAEIMTAMEMVLRYYESIHRISIRTDTRVTELLYEQEKIIGVQVDSNLEGRVLYANHVVLATGGFASDRSHGSLLEQYRPELLNMATTAGSFSTGDGITMAEALGAGTRYVEKVQLHPTGFVDPNDRDNPNKVLAAELLRGYGGVLVNQRGRRFCNELGTRNNVTDMMLQHNEDYASTGKWDHQQTIPTFYLVLPARTVNNEVDGHMSLYAQKGLVTSGRGIEFVADRLGIPVQDLESTMRQYISSAKKGVDEFGKTFFPGLPREENLYKETFFLGEVTPVLHYCMGGIAIDSEGRVLTASGVPIVGLHAAGEVTGGVHGNNRLGGNSLLECAVFGSIVGQSIPIDETISFDKEIHRGESMPPDAFSIKKEAEAESRLITKEELYIHNTPGDCWVAIDGKVYDLTDFSPRHPGGMDSILSLAGTDGSIIFSALHSPKIRDGIHPYMVGTFKDPDTGGLDATSERTKKETVPQLVVQLDSLGLHNSPDDCWISFFGIVYDVTAFATIHPGGSFVIQKHCGKDASIQFQVFHKERISLLDGIENSAVGKLEKLSNSA